MLHVKVRGKRRGNIQSEGVGHCQACDCWRFGIETYGTLVTVSLAQTRKGLKFQRVEPPGSAPGRRQKTGDTPDASGKLGPVFRFAVHEPCVYRWQASSMH